MVTKEQVCAFYCLSVVNQYLLNTVFCYGVPCSKAKIYPRFRGI